MITMFKTFSIFLFQDPVFLFKFIWRFLDTDYSLHVKFIEDQELFRELEKGKSIIRLGDGDMGVIHGKSIFHQEANPNLAQALLEIIKDYKPESPYILFVPRFLNLPNSVLKQKGSLICWLPFKIEFFRSFSQDMKYGDAHFFYYLNNTQNFFERFILHHNILFVTNSGVLKKIKENKTLDQSKLFFVEIPPERTFDQLDQVYSKIDQVLQAHRIDRIILSCGCSSRLVADTYAKRGYQCIDTGLGLNSYLDNKDYSQEVKYH